MSDDNKYLCSMFALVMCFMCISGFAGYAFGRTHGEQDVAVIRAEIVQARVKHQDKLALGVANEKNNSKLFRDRVIRSQPYVELLRILSGTEEKIKDLEGVENE